MQILSGRRHRVEELVFSHCGRWLAACGSNGGVHVWDTSNPTAKPLVSQPTNRVAALAFRADGRLFFQIRHGKWYLFDPAANELHTLDSPHVGFVIAASDAQHIIRVNARSPIVSWGFSSDDEPVQQLTVKSQGADVITAAFAPDGATFATAERVVETAWYASLNLIVRGTADGKRICSLAGAALTTTRLRFSSRGEYLVANWGATLARWALNDPQKSLQKGVNPSRKHLQSLAVHPDGPFLTVDNERLVRVWDVPSLATDRTIAWNIGKLYAVAVSPDGTRAAVGSHTGKVLVWDWD